MLFLLVGIQQPVSQSQTPSKIFSLPIIKEWFKALSTMNHTKATGTDNIPAKALKIAAPHISIVLPYHTALVTTPPEVTPVFKGGCKTERDNITDLYQCFCASRRPLKRLRTML